MRFVVDECTGPFVALWLRQHGHDVVSIYHDARGLDDDAILALANRQDRIVITNDKDFGDMIFRDHQAHNGVILLRLDDERAMNKIRVLERLLSQYPDALMNQFVVVTDKAIRFVRFQR